MATTTKTRKRRNTFFRTPGGSATVFTCSTCGRRTRNTGVQSLGSELCPQCYELAGIQNEISDGHCTLAERRATIDRYIAEIEAKGGNPREEFAGLLAPAAEPEPAPAAGREWVAAVAEPEPAPAVVEAPAALPSRPRKINL